MSGSFIVGNYPYMVLAKGKPVFLIGPDFKTNLCVWTCVLVPCVAYIAGPLANNPDKAAAWAVMCSIMALTLGALFKVSCMDPGICVPPRGFPIDKDLSLPTDEEAPEASISDVNPTMIIEEDSNESSDGGMESKKRPLNPTSLVAEAATPGDGPPGTRWCQKCRNHQPTGSSHCRDCDVCVYGYDHHCPFMGQCVGGGNITAFYTFLVMVIVLPLAMFAMMIALEGKKNNNQPSSRL